MEDKPFPLNLDQVVFTRSIVIAIPEHKPGALPMSLTPENSVDLSKVDGDPNRYMVTMRTVFNPNGDVAAPYIVDMECVAIFVVDPELSEEERIKGLTITGHSVAYGAIREAVSWITGRQPFGSLALGLSILKSQSTTAAPQKK